MFDWIGNIAGIAGKALNWLGDNEWAGDMLNQGIRHITYDQPEFDYEKWLDMAIAENIMRNPDVSNAFGFSRSVTDPETGKTSIEAGFNPQIQGLLDAMVGRMYGPLNEYQSPLAGTGMLDALVRERQDFQGIPQTDLNYWRPNYVQPQVPADPEESDEPALPAGATPGARPGGSAPGIMEPADPTGHGTPGRPGDITGADRNPMGGASSGFRYPGMKGFQGSGNGWNPSDKFLIGTENALRNKFLQGAAGQVLPGAGLAMGIGGHLVGNEIDRRAQERMNPNTNWVDANGRPVSNVPNWINDPLLNMLEGGQDYWDNMLSRNFEGGNGADRGGRAGSMGGSWGGWQKDTNDQWVFRPRGH